MNWNGKTNSSCTCKTSSFSSCEHNDYMPPTSHGNTLNWWTGSCHNYCCLHSVIIRVRVVFRKTVAGDWHFGYVVIFRVQWRWKCYYSGSVAQVSTDPSGHSQTAVLWLATDKVWSHIYCTCLQRAAVDRNPHPKRPRLQNNGLRPGLLKCFIQSTSSASLIYIWIAQSPTTVFLKTTLTQWSH